MVSVEQHIAVENSDYRAEQQLFDADAMDLMGRHGLGVVRLDHHAPDSDDQIDYRVDPTIISTDIESVRLGKDLGASRAVELLAAQGVTPQAWRTVGDSRTDYAMADWLHHNDHPVKHVDVRPADGVPVKPYEVLTAADLGLGEDVIHDDAGAAFLRSWRRPCRLNRRLKRPGPGSGVGRGLSRPTPAAFQPRISGRFWGGRYHASRDTFTQRITENRHYRRIGPGRDLLRQPGIGRRPRRGHLRGCRREIPDPPGRCAPPGPVRADQREPHAVPGHGRGPDVHPLGAGRRRPGLPPGPRQQPPAGHRRGLEGPQGTPRRARGGLPR